MGLTQINENTWRAWDARGGMEVCDAKFVVDPSRKDHLDVLREIWVDDIYMFESVFPDVRHESLVVDVGAHIGTVAVRAALSGANVIALEPFEEAYGYLSQNVSINMVDDRVQLLKMPLSDVPTTIHRDHDTGMGVCESSDNDETDFCTIKNLLSLVNGRPIALLKIDVEGWEHSLIRNVVDMRELFGLCERIAFETHPFNDARLGTILETLLYTHSIEAGGNPDIGGYINAHKY